MKINKKLILTLNNFILGSLTPDLTFVHTVNKKNLAKRLNLRKRKNRYDLFNYNFYKIVQNGFLKIGVKTKPRAKKTLIGKTKFIKPGENKTKAKSMFSAEILPTSA